MLGISGVELSSGSSHAVPPRLVNSAHEFEAQMMKELLKPLVDQDGTVENTDSGSTGAMGEFAADALGRALSTGGGLGIANEVIRSLSQEGNVSQSAGMSGKLQGNAVLKQIK